MILDEIKYFAKYVNKEVLRRMFSLTPKDNLAEYEALKDYMDELDADIIPDLAEYIFSSNEEVIRERLRNMKGYFLMFEYGAFAGSVPNSAGVREGSMGMSLIIGCKPNQPTHDNVSEAIVMDKCFQFLTTIKAHMEEDNKELCASRRINESSYNISPAEPSFIFGCVGWVMTFNRANNLIA